MTSISSYAFYGCSGLTGNLTIGNSVTSISSYAFSYCSGLASITVYAETPPTTYSYTFYNCPKSIPLYVPCGSLEAYQSAANWSAFTNVQESCSQQTITLFEGWNWISVYVEADDLLEQLEESLGDNGVQIKSKTLVTAWDEDEEEWTGSLQNVGLSNDKTYLVQTTAACQVTLVGQACTLADYTITLNPGWNWIGFPNEVAVSVEEAFSGFEAVEGDQIKSKTFVAGWDSDEEEWSGTLTVLTPGQGYMFYSATSGARTLTFQTAQR